jgi:hypothetical protein
LTDKRACLKTLGIRTAIINTVVIGEHQARLHSQTDIVTGKFWRGQQKHVEKVKKEEENNGEVCISI